MSRNREIAEAFAAAFDPPLAVVQTQRINNVPHRDAWVAAAFDPQTQIGVTAHAYGGQLHAYLEALGEDGAAVGRIMAATMGRLKDERKPLAEGPENTGLGAQEGDGQ